MTGRATRPVAAPVAAALLTSWVLAALVLLLGLAVHGRGTRLLAAAALVAGLVQAHLTARAQRRQASDTRSA